jgi:hypothetical protein
MARTPRQPIRDMKIDQRDADAALGSEVHRHSSWTMPAILVLITAAIGVGIFVYLTGPTVQDLQGTTPSPTASAEPIDLKIDGIAFRIPAYYTASRAARGGGDQDEVDLHVLLPDLHPWTSTDRAAFESNAPDARVVHFTLKPDHQTLTDDQRFERALRPQTLNPQGVPGPHGLTQFDFPTGLGYDDVQIFIAPLDAKTLLVLRCDKAGAQQQFGPSCTRQTRTPDGVGLTYRFKRAHLAQWQTIDSGITQLVARFRTAAPK